MCCAVLCLVAQSCLTLCDPMNCSPLGSSVHGDSPGKNTVVGCHALLQGIFPTQGSNPGLSHCMWIFHHLSHKGSPRILEWVAHPFSRDLPDPGIEPGSPALQVDSLPRMSYVDRNIEKGRPIFSQWTLEIPRLRNIRREGGSRSTMCDRNNDGNWKI